MKLVQEVLETIKTAREKVGIREVDAGARQFAAKMAKEQKKTVKDNKHKDGYIVGPFKSEQEANSVEDKYSKTGHQKKLYLVTVKQKGGHWVSIVRL